VIVLGVADGERNSIGIEWNDFAIGVDLEQLVVGAGRLVQGN
jgi:hypothetical protein